MTIEQLVAMAKRIHDAEGWNLGAASSRDTRNAFWARVIGCAHWGHPLYNLFPDPQWHLKRTDPTRPQTDDVATSMPSRHHWDCIPGAGADGYRFEATPHGPLPSEQIVYPPPKPEGSGAQPGPSPGVQPYPSESPDGGWWGQVFDVEVKKRYASAKPPRVYPDPSDPKSLRWASRVAYDIRDGLTKEASLAKHLQTLEQELGL